MHIGLKYLFCLSFFYFFFYGNLFPQTDVTVPLYQKALRRDLDVNLVKLLQSVLTDSTEHQEKDVVSFSVLFHAVLGPKLGPIHKAKMYLFSQFFNNNSQLSNRSCGKIVNDLKI